MIKPIIDHLSSGLTVIRVPMSGSPSVTVTALANTGSRYESPQEAGIAHFLEHMVFKGTKNYPTAQKLALAIDRIGANFNAFTDKEYTGYYVQAASSHLPVALDVISDMLLTPKLRQEDINREKGVIIEEINMYLDSPMQHVNDVFEKMAYRGSGLGHDVLGNKSTVKKMTRADFRKFLRSWYGLSNIVLVVAGDATVLKNEKIVKLIADYFSKETSERVTGKVQLDRYLSLKKGPLSSKRLAVKNKDTKQAHIVLGWPSFSRHDERRYALGLYAILMGGYMSSRLFTQIREKRGLCYYISASNEQYHDGGMLMVSAGIDVGRVKMALETILQEFAKSLKGRTKITQSELQTAKDHFLGKMALGLEDSRGVARFFGLQQLLRGKIENPDELSEKIRAISLEEVLAVAEEVVRPAAERLAVIGDFNEHDFFRQLIHLE